MPTNLFTCRYVLLTSLILPLLLSFSSPLFASSTTKPSTHPATKTAAQRAHKTTTTTPSHTHLQQYLPNQAPAWISIHPKRWKHSFPHPKKHAHRVNISNIKPCRLFTFSLRMIWRRRTSTQGFMAPCSAALALNKKSYFVPIINNPSQMIRTLWTYGALSPDIYKRPSSLLKTDISMWLLTTKPGQQHALVQAIKDHLSNFSMKPWSTTATGLPYKTLILKGDQSISRGARVAVLIPRKNGVQLFITQHELFPKQGSTRWATTQLNDIINFLKTKQTKARMTQAKQAFLKTASVAGIYFHGQNVLEAGTLMGTRQALEALQHVPKKMKRRLFGTFLRIAALPKLLMSSPVADGEDLTVFLTYKNKALSLQYVQSLTDTGRNAYKAGAQHAKQELAIQPQAPTPSLDLSFQFDVLSFLQSFVSPLPWLHTPVQGKTSARDLRMAQLHCGASCAIAQFVMGPGYYTAQMMSLKGHQLSWLPSLPRRTRLIVLPTTKKKQPHIVLAAEFEDSQRRGALAMLLALKQRAAQRHWTLTHTFVARKHTTCLLVGLNTKPTPVFGGCNVRPTKRLYHINTQLQELHKLLSKAGVIGHRHERHLRALKPFTSAFTSMQMTGWLTQDSIIHKLTLCPKACTGTKPALYIPQVPPLPQPSSWPPTGDTLCLLKAQQLTYKLNDLSKATNPTKLLHTLWKELQTPLQCLRMSPKHQHKVKTFEALWRARLQHKTAFHWNVQKTHFVLSKGNQQRTLNKRRYLYPSQDKKLNLTLILKQHGVTIATRGSVLSKGCKLSPSHLASKKTPLGKRLTCPHKQGQTNITCISTCLKKIKTFFPSVRDVYLFIPPKEQAYYTVGLDKSGKLTQLTQLLWELPKQKTFVSTTFTLLNQYHTLTGGDWTYWYEWYYNKYRIQSKNRSKNLYNI